MGEESELYERYYPHPARGLDVEAARKRVLSHPEVMPPHPEPVQFARWQVREHRGGLRSAGVFTAVLVGVLAPLVIRAVRRWASPRRGRPAYLARPRRGMVPTRRSVLLLARR